MSHLLRTMMLLRNKSISVPDLISYTKDISYPKEVLNKTASLERIGGVKYSGQTYYSELKKSNANMQKCNIFLERESELLKTALLALKFMSNNLSMLNKGVEPLLRGIGHSLLQITGAQYIMMIAKTDKLVSQHVPEPYPERDKLDNYFSDYLNKVNVKHFPHSYGICPLHFWDEENLSFLSERYGLNDMAAFPMVTRGKILGLILLFFGEHKANTEYLSTLETLGNQTAVVLENAKLFEDTLQLKNEAEAQREQLKQKNHELKNMYNILFHTREEQIITQERNRIAEDLHDNVLQILYAIGLHFEWCLNELAVESPVYSKLKNLDQLVERAAREIRKVVGEFDSKETSVSLPNSVQRLASDLNQVSPVKIYVQTIGSIPLLPSVIRNIAFRIVQEALVNALRHASATKINITIAYVNENLEIAIQDNGVGIFDNIMETIHSDDKKFGLKNMAQRAQYINGRLKIHRLTSGGTEVLAVIPV